MQRIRVHHALVISPTNGADGERTVRCEHYSARPMARVSKPKSKREETKEPLARPRVLPLSAEGFQDMVGIVAGRTTHGRNGLITSAYCTAEKIADTSLIRT